MLKVRNDELNTLVEQMEVEKQELLEEVNNLEMELKAWKNTVEKE